MITNTDSQVEDRIRAAFKQMMPVILGEDDQRVRRNTVASATDQVIPQRTIDLFAAGGRPRRTPSLIVALAACVALVVGGIVLLSRRVAEVDDNPASTTPAIGDILLLPPDAVTANELDQVAAGSWTSAVETPAGDVLGIMVATDFGGDFPKADVRTIGALTVASVVGAGSQNYIARFNCGLLSVSTSATVPTWDASVTDLLAAVTPNSDGVTVTLPVAWKELATGPQGDYFNTAFTHTIGASKREMRLFQSRNTNVAQFLSQTYRGTALPVTYDQSPAWIIHSNDSSQWNYLIWSTGTTAAMLGGQAISDADLIATAKTLVSVRPDEWNRRVNAALPTAESATITPTTLRPIPIGDPSGCTTTTIRFN